MESRGFYYKPFIFAGVILLCLVLFSSEKSYAFSNQVIQRGATGEDVVELQARLQYNGYYNGNIDGVFGWGTYWAVRNFQDQFQIGEVDGLVGEKTKQKLISKTKYYEGFVREQLEKGKKFTHYGGMPLKYQTGPSAEARRQARKKAEARQTLPDEQKKPAQQQAKQNKKQPAAKKKVKPVAANRAGGYSQNDIRLLSQAVYGEARGEPYDGQVAIAAVILNRLDSPNFPDTISGVIFEPLAFTAVADGQIYMEPDKTAKEAVMDAINGWDPSENATYYFNPDTATNPWIWGRPQIKRIGKHIFCE
ncbi:MULTISPECIES: spore cortex-lytic enzyme [Bacillus]|uniref:Spore cortex-lytic enzyme n=2 Tax=Bacillus TaxID=1386 RepID=A0A0M4FG48_9BACI|nr:MULTISPECIES: spore cortex-lytic enzyme [Bacillus]ALC81437.1 spore cortex-lytic protein [Bacillus gobiensis]MBP1080472.1 N-acetylmuramoyl-L-alanine amidase [Bacillus capparidis]MED1094329.1 spore cortex-lytic enzyme [Bacillus capparidis]